MKTQKKLLFRLLRLPLLFGAGLTLAAQSPKPEFLSRSGGDRPNPNTEVSASNGPAATHRSRLARTFTEENWISMGGIPGVDGFVSAAVVDTAGRLYVAGNFTIAGDVFARGIARWDGIQWSALGEGVGGGDDAYVSELVVSAGSLYAGVKFTRLDGNLTNYLAQWDGAQWSPLREAVRAKDYANLSALAVLGADLYVGGSFTIAGGQVSANLARLRLDWSPQIPLEFVPGSIAISGGTFNALLKGPEGSRVVVDSSSWELMATNNLPREEWLRTPWRPVATNTLRSEGWSLSLPIDSGSQQFHRARLVQ
ncbi:MAG TPA: hypothetical protein PLX89_26360 [Verrucomicrobiota bacterium]|nr:hypothetical protein [Verrucomicrobiales bacterium]HRI16532.1 hypothetical protein [Verrucomicrobiota bacterium]